MCLRRRLRRRPACRLFDRLGFEQPARLDQFLLRLDQQHFAGALFGRAVEHSINRGGRAAQCVADGVAAQMLKKEQGGDCVARPVHRDRQVRRAQPKPAGPVGSQEIYAIRRRFLRVQRGHENHPRAKRMQRIDRPQNVCQCLGRTAGKLIELEVIVRDDVGRRDGAIS